MNIEQRLVQAFEDIAQGNARQAENHLRRILDCDQATLVQKYVAAKGICDAMDAQGYWIESETFWSNTDARLKAQASRPAPCRQPRPARTNWLALACGVGFGLITADILCRR